MPSIGWAAMLAVLSIGLAFTATHIPPLGVAIWYAALFVPYIALLVIRGEKRLRWKELIGVALLIRIALVFADPLLSYDISRYVFEGRVTLEGLNPFVETPMSFNVRHLRDDVIWESINHKHLAAIYPPGAQFFFAAVALFNGGWALMKFAFVVVEIGGGVLIWFLFRDSWSIERFESGLLFYALNPLVFIEVAWSGHLDVLAWVPLTIALMWIADRETWKSTAGAGALIGISITAKFLGVLFLPYLLFRKADQWKPALLKRTSMLAIAMLVVLFSYAPFADAGKSLFGAFGKYAASWQNNEGYFRLFEKTALETLRYEREEKDPIFHFSQYDAFAVEHDITKLWKGEEIPNTTFTAKQIANATSKVVGAIIMAFVLLACLVLIRDPVRGVCVLMFCLYCVAPTVHPWYVAWLVPLAIWRRDFGVLVFSALCLFGYSSWVAMASGGKWYTPEWVSLVEFGTLTLLVLLTPKWITDRIGTDDEHALSLGEPESGN